MLSGSGSLGSRCNGPLGAAKAEEANTADERRKNSDSTRACNVFDISTPSKPREIAYFNKPILKGSDVNPTKAGSFAMSAPAYDEKTGDIWYTDGNSGFYVVRMTGVAAAKPFAAKVVLPGN